MKVLILFILILLQIGCCRLSENSNIDEYGLIGKIKQITEYTFLNNNDLANELKNDTIIIKNKYYNDFGKLVKNTVLTTFDNKFTSYEYIYNGENRIIKEIVKSDDSLDFIVFYKYKDSIIISSNSLIEYEDFNLKNVTSYEYDENNILKREISKRLAYLRETGDTISDIKEISEYNSRKFLTETVISYEDSTGKTEKFVYQRNCDGSLQKTKFYKNGELEKKSTNEYLFDANKNWIEMKEYDNDTLRKIIKRTIIYK